MAVDIAVTKKSRSVLRRSMTKICNELDALLQMSEKDADGIRAHMDLLETKYQELTGMDNLIFTNMIENVEIKDDELDKEVNSADEYKFKFHKIKAAVTKLLQEDDRNSVASALSVNSSSSRQVKRSYKLPLLELKKFGGELKDWLPFWSQFRKIDEDPLLDPSDKFQYLIQATISGSKARDLVESFPATAENYGKVISSLKARYGKDDLLVEVYIRELLSLILQNAVSPNKICLSSLYDKLQSHIEALGTLGVTTDKCNSMLLPLVESCLPEDILRTWERNSSITLLGQSSTGCSAVETGATGVNGLNRLGSLMHFLRCEVQQEQKIALAMSGFGVLPSVNVKGSIKKKDKNLNYTNNQAENVPTAAGLLTASNRETTGCVFCSANHKSQDCFKAQKMTLQERRQALETKRCCFSCLKVGHPSKKCKNRPRCIICGRGHFVVMCDKLQQTQVDSAVEKPNITGDKTASTSQVQKDEALASLSNHCGVLMQTLVVKVRGKGAERTVRALIDSASQRSYILKSTATEMGYQISRQENIQHSLFGGTTTGINKHCVYTIYLSSLDGNYNCHFEALDQTRICGAIPSVHQGPWIEELSSQDIVLSDIDSDGPIEVLIGADVAGKLFTGGHKVLSTGLVAMETRLGWILMGKVPSGHSNEESVAMMVTAMITREARVSDLWTLDALGIMDPAAKKNKLELQEAAHQHFLNTVKINEDGRFECCLPWIENHSPLPNNYNMALKRIHSTVKRLKSEGYYDAYQSVLDEWIQEGVIEEVPEETMNVPCHYLPHRHVVKQNSTTPVRPVFDASACENKNPSINSCVEKGPNLIELLPSVLARFRLKRIGVVADIRRAFLQISICKGDRPFLRFLWIDRQGTLKFYQHCRVVFGVTCSPYLLGAVIKYHLQTVLDQCKKGTSSYSQDLVELLSQSFYVDNCVTSVDDVDQLQQFIDEATSIMRERKFELRGWEFTNPSLPLGKPTSVLGLLWDKSEDTLYINVDKVNSICLEKITKKIILSVAHRIFDPIGVACSVTLLPKLLLQQTWESGIGWDQEVNEDIKSQFLTWMRDLPYLGEIKIPRWLPGSDSQENWTIHIFCDASQHSYAAVAYLRVEHQDQVHVQLILAKARVSPISKPNKKMTIPRLELLAATIGSRLYSNIVQDFNIIGVKTIFWSDATTVLAWIQREDQWDVFISNRVKEIRELTDGHEWRHVPGNMNPADLPSRGVTAKKLLESRWWEGPNWLREPPSTWPKVDVQYDEEEITRGKKKSIVSSMLTVTVESDWYYARFSTFEQSVRLIGWLYRFVKNCQTKKHDRFCGNLTTEELVVSELKVINMVQKQAFSGVNDPKLSNLVPFIDSNGIIRLMTKVSHRKDLNSFCQPAVLPNSEHPVVFRLIMDLHKKSCHAGPQMMLTLLREKFWILRGRQTIRSVLDKCLQCKKQTVKHLEVYPAPLPEDRVRNAKIFEVTGVDLAGPLYLKLEKGRNKKAWVCLYTCGVYRAVHLELISSLSTDSFIQSFRRFISRRGRPSLVYSDNGTNFAGTDNAFKKLDWDAINLYSTARRIKWKFNPPTASWWGGWWERLIGILKRLLRRVLGRTSVCYEEMQTILCDCEAVINARPLTYVSQNPSDLIPLTPSMFLQEVEEIGVPDFDLVESTDLNKRLRYRQKLREDLRRRFRSEYLGQLMLLANRQQHRQISVGKIVLVGNDNTKRIEWPLARVVELLKGPDGETRLVRVKTSSGLLLRPVQRIYPLELELGQQGESTIIGGRLREEIAVPPRKENMTITEETPRELAETRSGRMVRKPIKLNL